jgi:hypothetical protein
MEVEMEGRYKSAVGIEGSGWKWTWKEGIKEWEWREVDGSGNGRKV